MSSFATHRASALSLGLLATVFSGAVYAQAVSNQSDAVAINPAIQ